MLRFSREQTNILRQYCRYGTPIVETSATLFHINNCFCCKNIFGTVFVVYLRKRLNGKHKIYQAGDQQWIRLQKNQSYEKGLNDWVQTKAAELLGISERVLRYKMKKGGVRKGA